MTFLFRVDANVNIGCGHLIRCLSLAHVLKEKQQHVVFAGEIKLPEYIALLEKAKIDVLPLDGLNDESLKALTEHSQNNAINKDALDTLTYARNLHAHMVIADSYKITRQWQTHFQNILPLFTFEDIPGRRHLSQLLLDPTINRTPQNYKNIVNDDCQLLLGSDYTLLRPEFNKLRKTRLNSANINTKENNTALRYSKKIKVLIFFGGTDPAGISYQVIKKLPSSVKATALLSEQSPAFEQVRTYALAHPHITLVSYCKGMAEFMAQFDIIIGAPGSNSWERCCLGIPSLTLTLADNQRDIATVMEKKGAALNFGYATEENINKLVVTFFSLITDIEQLKLMATRALSLCDGLGAERVCEQLLHYLKKHSNNS
jgi:UDP-2,4-diacetamido-2,4,6-trideoxy-beta-L-altropyranose hydrolase